MAAFAGTGPFCRAKPYPMSRILKMPNCPRKPLRDHSRRLWHCVLKPSLGGVAADVPQATQAKHYRSFGDWPKHRESSCHPLGVKGARDLLTQVSTTNQSTMHPLGCDEIVSLSRVGGSERGKRPKSVVREIEHRPEALSATKPTPSRGLMKGFVRE